MFKPGDLVSPSDGEMGLMIRRVFANSGLRIEFPVAVEAVSATGGLCVVGDHIYRNKACFELCNDGPW